MEIKFIASYLWGRSNERNTKELDSYDLRELIKFIYLNFGFLPVRIAVTVKEDKIKEGDGE